MTQSVSNTALAALAALAVTFGGLSAIADEPQRPNVGTVEDVRNRAEALFGGEVRRLAPEAPLLYRDLMRTGPEARLQALLDDGSQLVMGENAELEIDEFVQVPGTSRSVTLDLLEGALRFISGKLQPGADSGIHIRTPVAILGVRGTDLWVGPIDGATGVLVTTGEVVVGTDHAMVTLGPGEGTMIKPDGSLSPVKRWGQAKVDRALAAVALD
jgi:hypothetical protein